MAIHHTPLTAYLNVKNTNQEQARMAGEVFKGIANKVGEKYDEYKTKQFFESLGDSNEKAYLAQADEIDARLAELNKELETVNGQIAEMENEPVQPTIGEDGSVTEAVGSAFSGLERAEKLRGLRDKEGSLQEKIANLNDQKAEAVKRADELKAKRESLTDDEIVRMAKVVGIKDEDISAYVNGRITQRNADLAKQGGVNAANEIAAQKSATDQKSKEAKDAQIEAATTQLEAMVRDLSDINRRIATSEAADREKAKNEKRALLPQFERRKAKYEELTGEAWSQDPVEYGAGNEGDNEIDNQRQQIVIEIQKAKNDPNFDKASADELQQKITSLFLSGLPESEFKTLYTEVGDILPNRAKEAKAEEDAAKAERRGDIAFGQSQEDRAKNKAKEKAADDEKKAKEEKAKADADELEKLIKDMNLSGTYLDNFMSEVKKNNPDAYEILKNRVK